MKKKVLIVDNDPDYLETYADILQRAGYNVMSTTSSEEAERIMTDSWVHLAIIDVRLRKDMDRYDTSGISLAKKVSYRHIPKIILTRYPNYDQVRKTLGPALVGLPAAVDFISKKEGKQALLTAIEKALSNYVRINETLDICFDDDSRLSFQQLAMMIDPSLDRVQAASRAEELEDLFRLAFEKEKLIRINGVYWRDRDRVALRVFAFSNLQSPTSLLVVCGKQEAMARESKSASESAVNIGGPRQTLLKRSVNVTHFGVCVYSLTGTDEDTLATMVDLYRGNHERGFSKAVESLFQETLEPYFKEKYQTVEWGSLEDLCQDRFGFSIARFKGAEYERRLKALARQLPTIDAALQAASGKLNFHFGSEGAVSPDPIEAIPCDIELPLLINAPVIISGERVLVDGDGNAWLTDFAGAGPMPQFWHFVMLEALIRFDWIENAPLTHLHKFEKSLVADFTFFNISDMDASVRPAARAIQAVRKAAVKMVNEDLALYHWGMVYEALRRFASFNPDLPPVRNELRRMLHLLLAASLSSSKLSLPATPKQAPRGGEIKIDKENQVVMLRGQKLRLRGIGYKILCLLAERPGQLYSQQDIIEQAFDEPYRPNDEYQQNRLYVGISRLRKVIGDDAENPGILLNEPGGGYRLSTESK